MDGFVLGCPEVNSFWFIVYSQLDSFQTAGTLVSCQFSNVCLFVSVSQLAQVSTLALVIYRLTYYLSMII